MPLTALPGFDVDNEIAVFKQVGIEVNRDISIHFDIATVDTLSTLLSHGKEERWNCYTISIPIINNLLDDEDDHDTDNNDDDDI